MSQVQYPAHVMFCNSTGNQAVNLLPILQLKCSKSVLISTQHTENSGSTKRLRDLLHQRNIDSKKLVINSDEEKNLKQLTYKILEFAKGHARVLWNISGGQKIPAAAMLDAFQKRSDDGFQDDYVTYVEAVPPEIWYFGHDYKSHKIRTSVTLSLQDILYLSNFETMKDENKLYPACSEDIAKNIETGRMAFEYFKENDHFREAFFSHMKPSDSYSRTKKEIEEIIKKVLNSIKPKLNEITISKIGYENLEKKINHVFSSLDKAKNKEDIQKLINPLKLIQKPAEIYDDYWTGIKNKIVCEAINRIEHNEVSLINSSINAEGIKKLTQQIKNIGGESTYESGSLYKKHIPVFSSLKRNGILFEWMAAAEILEQIEKDDKLRDSVSEIYHSVKTRKLGSTKKHDAEHDIVIVTKFGTLIIIELKTYEFSGDIAQAQEGLAYKKSGPYGTAMIIGPLLSNMIKTGKNGQKEFPAYIDGPIKSQEDTAKQNNIDYYYIDNIADMLKKQLHLKLKG
jgi:hypothetical protein